MLKSAMNFFGKYPSLKKIYHSILWEKYKLSDFCNTYFFKSKIEVSTPFGYKMTSRKYIANRMMLKGTFEKEEFDIVHNHLNSSEVFVDVGANIGYYTCIARSLGKYVVAFEPQAQNLECLYANLKRNGWSDTEIYPIGLGCKPGLLDLYGASGPSASLVKGWAGYSERFKKTIPINTLDNILCDRFDGKRLFIKIDVEGAEYGVLQGAINTLNISPRPTWFIEICLSEFHPEEINPNFMNTFDLFWQHGYEVLLANKENRYITSDDIKGWVSDKRTNLKEFNYLFIPKQ